VGSGLLYGGIGVLWVVVLSRSWLNRRSIARAEREAPPSSRQRILDPGPRGARRVAGRGGSGHRLRGGDRAAGRRVAGIVAPGGIVGPGDTGGRHAVVSVQPAVRRPSRATRRRRRILLALLVVASTAAAAAAGHRLPWWSAVGTACLAAGWFVLVTFAARAGRRSRRQSRRRTREGERAGAGRHPGGPLSATSPTASAGPVDSAGPEVLVRAEDGASAWPASATGPVWVQLPAVDLLTRDDRATQLVLAPTSTIAPTGTVARTGSVAVGPTTAPAGAGQWQPTPVPLPTYVTAPRAPRVVSRIDLGCPGAWTAAAQAVGEDTARVSIGLVARSGRRTGATQVRRHATRWTRRRARHRTHSTGTR